MKLQKHHQVSTFCNFSHFLGHNKPYPSCILSNTKITSPAILLVLALAMYCGLNESNRHVWVWGTLAKENSQTMLAGPWGWYDGEKMSFGFDSSCQPCPWLTSQAEMGRFWCNIHHIILASCCGGVNEPAGSCAPKAAPHNVAISFGWRGLFVSCRTSSILCDWS